MKVAVVTALFPPEFTGGSERVALMHARALAARGHDVRVVTGTLGGAPVGSSLVEGLPVTRLGRPFGSDPLVAGLDVSADLADTIGEVDVIHVQHAWTFGAGVVHDLSQHAPVVLSLHDFTCVCPRFFRVPHHGVTCPDGAALAGRELDACVRCVAPELGGGPDAIADELALRLDLWEEDLIAAARVLVPSRTHLVRLADLIDLRGKARIHRPGVCHEFSGEIPRPRAWDGQGPLRILHPVRRSVAKGTLDLVRAVAALPPGRVELLCLGGAEPELDERLVGIAGSATVRLEGPYEALDLEQAASTCHLAALPSRLPESYALAVDEALYLGLPVWASSADAARERFGDGPVRVLPAREPEAWTQALHDLLEDPGALREGFDALPQTFPTAHDAAAELERHFEEILPDPDVRRAG